MKTKTATVVLLALSAAMGASAANAQQSPCYSYPPGSERRIACLRKEQSAAEQYFRDMNGIANELEDRHRSVGRRLGAVSRLPGAPAITRVMPYAWDVPRHLNDALQGAKRNSQRETREQRRRSQRR